MARTIEERSRARAVGTPTAEKHQGGRIFAAVRAKAGMA